MKVLHEVLGRINVAAALICIFLVNGSSALSQPTYRDTVAERLSGRVEIWGVELTSDTEDDPYVSILLVGRGIDKGEESCSDHLIRIPKTSIIESGSVSTEKCQEGPVYSFKIKPNTYVIEENFIPASRLYEALLPDPPFRPQASSILGTAGPPPVGILTCKGVNDCDILIVACIAEKNGDPVCEYNDKGQASSCYCL